MAFIVKLFYYCFLFATAALSVYYIFSGLTGMSTHNNPFYLKQWLGLVSIYGLMQVYKAFIAGEQNHRYVEGLYQLAFCWLAWAALLLIYALISKLIN